MFGRRDGGPSTAISPAIREAITHADTETRDRRYRLALVLADISATVLALVFSRQLIGDAQPDPLVLLGIPLVLIVSKLSGLYDRDELLVRKTTIDEIPALFNHTTLYTLLFWLLAGALVDGEFGAPEAAGLWAALFTFTVLFRRFGRFVARELSPEERLLLVGDAGSYVRLVEKLEMGHVNARLVGRMSLLRPSQFGSDERTIQREELRRLVDELEVHRLLVVPSQSKPAATLQIVRVAKALGMRVSLVPQVMDVVGSAVVFDDVLGMTLLGMKRFDLSLSARVAKRSMDIVGALVGLTVLSPLLVAIAVAIKIDSRGPVFFRQARIGRDSRVIRIFKFRSMVADAEERKGELIEVGLKGGLFKIEDDPRLTRVGRLLRRCSLDELPQLINVLVGEMSLVGPRPLIASEDQAIKGLDRERLRLTPGMTGPWQLMGSRVPIHEMVKLDYLYVTGWSLMEDVGILIRTVRHVALRKGL